MGSSQSSQRNSIDYASSTTKIMMSSSSPATKSSKSVRGRKSTTKSTATPVQYTTTSPTTTPVVVGLGSESNNNENNPAEMEMTKDTAIEVEYAVSTDDEEELSEYSSSEEDDDEEWNERCRILEDARQLKQTARFFLHPEVSMMDSTVAADACARCYFNRPSAAVVDNVDEEEEVVRIQQDLVQLKKAAQDYLHPELPVPRTSIAAARNYFTRVSAPVCDDEDEQDEREEILEEVLQLKKLAADYMHPEHSVVCKDSTAYGRNFFTRPSAPDSTTVEEDVERARILQDAALLKQSAVHFLHPEHTVVTNDPTACGRNYFSRPDAPDTENDQAERAAILADAAALQQSAVDFLHPERPVVTADATVCGRNYFSRFSAPAPVDDDEEDEREEILEEALQLKKLAADYMHPEHSVVCNDSTAYGRNFFTRPSAPDSTVEEDVERARILEDAALLKQSAVHFLHPERAVVTSDPTVCGRNYFSRPDAPDTEDDQAERAAILADAAALKQSAVDFLHPERSLVTVDATVCGRNYFSRFSAPAPVDDDEEDEREEILEEALQLKKLAADYMHPERLVVCKDSTAYGRNFFSRPSAPAGADEEDRAAILADAAALKKLAVDYLHPEVPVITTDPTACGRNYFSRPSAPEDSDVDDDERALALADAAVLKQLAVNFLHPELPVKSTLCGRNFFSRPSAPDMENEAERAAILAESQQLKKLANDFMHPEVPVSTVDHSVCGRNYFARPSAPEQDDVDAANERASILADAQQLKKLATDYLHPECRLHSTACGRNYFNRPSAAGHDHMVHTFPSHEEDVTEYHEEHFGMDEELDMFHDMRENLDLPDKARMPSPVAKGPMSEEEESNLSRSPSSVMLFAGESIYD